MKIKSIPIDRYFELIKPQYVYLHIIPQKSIRNYNTSNITKAIAHTYKTIDKRIKIEQKKLFFQTEFKVSYVIDIYQNNADFYFIVPKPFSSLLKEKVSEVWNKATVEVLDTPIRDFSKTATRYQLSYDKLDAFSLDIDKKSNEPLNTILNVMNILKDDDRVTVCYNFMPCPQDGWKDRYDENILKLKSGKSISKDNTSTSAILKGSLGFLVSILDGIMEVFFSFFGGNQLIEGETIYNSIMKVFEKQIDLSPITKAKRESSIIQTQIGVVSESRVVSRQTTNGLAVCQSFSVLDGDNRLKYSKTKSRFNLEDFSFNLKSSYLSSNEASSLVQIPAKTLLDEYGINHVNINEFQIPEKLKTGYIPLGLSTYKGNTIMAYLEDHREIGSLPLVILGRQGGGKTTYLCNYANACLKRNESVVHIDFIRNCEASKKLEASLPKDKVIVLDFSKEIGLQSFAYNEIKFTDDMSWFEKQELANKKTQLTLELINSINENGDPLSAKMERYLTAACDIIYLNENATLRDIVSCLQDYNYRENTINNIPEELKDEFREEISTLGELDEYSRGSKDCPPEKIGTRHTKIEGILDRIVLLKRDFFLKKMFNKTPENNLDFVEAMEDGKVVLVRLPQSKFKPYVKNVITTFLSTKCWLACELRADMHEHSRRCHFLIDEISQTKTAEKFMESVLTQTRKFAFKYVITGQYLDQLDKKTIYSLKGAGSSFMLITGAIKEDFNYFREELGESFTYDDLKCMAEHSSLNLIHYSGGFSSFITKLPKPLHS